MGAVKYKVSMTTSVRSEKVITTTQRLRQEALMMIWGYLEKGHHDKHAHE